MKEICYFFTFLSLLAQKALKMTLSTSVLGCAVPKCWSKYTTTDLRKPYPIVPCPVDLTDSRLSERLRFIIAAVAGLELTFLTRMLIRKLLVIKVKIIRLERFYLIINWIYIIEIIICLFHSDIVIIQVYVIITWF